MLENVRESNTDSEARKIFNHLLMFQFYRDLKNFDKTLRSIYKDHSLSINEELDNQFLKDWVTEFATDEKCGKVQSSITSIRITVEDFEHKFEEVFPPGLPEYGGGFLTSIAVSNEYL